jgi:Tol biopolymer transport system component
VANLDDRARSRERVDAPDLWDRADMLERRPDDTVVNTRERVTVIAMTLLLTLATTGFVVFAFHETPSRNLPASDVPVVSSSNGELYFRVGGGDGPSWWETVQADGSAGRTVFAADEPVHFDHVAWSPDGTRIAFRNALVDAYGIYTANADGSDVRRLTEGPNDSWPSWSPDGTRIVFSSTRSHPSVGTCVPGDDVQCPTDLYVMNADGSDVTQVSGDPSREFDPAWSPDGTAIAFVRADIGPGCCTTAIWTMGADGSDPHEVAGTADGSNFAPSWSLDGTRLTYLSIRGEEWWVFVSDADGSDERAIAGTPFADDAGSLAEVDDAVWAPDGSWIAFTGSVCPCDALSHPALYLMHPDGTDLHAIVTPDYGASDIAWRPLFAEATPTPPPRIDASIGQTVDIGLRFPEGAVVAYGGVWVAASDGMAAGGELLRLDPDDGEIVARIAMPTVPGWEFGGAGIASGLGSVWLTAGRADEPHTPTVVYRIDPDTNSLAETIDVGAGGAADIWVDDSGIWVVTFADEGGHMWLYHLDVTSHEVLSRTSIPANWSNNVSGAGGWIWVLGNTDDSDGAPPGTLFRIDPTTGDIQDRFDPDPHNSFFLTVSGNRLWFFKSDGLYALDGGTGSEIAGPLQLPAQCCSGLVADGSGGVWVISGTGSETERKGVWHVSSDGIIDQHSAENPGELADGISVAYDPTTTSVWIVHYQDTVSRLEITAAGG